MKSKIDSIFINHNEERICQGDIFRDFEYLEYTPTSKKTGTGIMKTFPYLLVLSQDCDLESDCRSHTNSKDTQDKFLFSILVCPGYLSEELREGTHLEEYKLKMQRINTDRWNNIKNNQNPRYHFLEGEKTFQIPDLVLDFKHYYAISRDVLYKNFRDYYLGSINELFREALSQRFAYYLSRIGLKIINKDERYNKGIMRLKHYIQRFAMTERGIKVKGNTKRNTKDGFLLSRLCHNCLFCVQLTN